MLFLLIMLPNFIWFAVPAPHDVLRAGTGADILDGAASLFQVWLVAALCAVRNKGAGKPAPRPLILPGACILFYYACWAAYYSGMASVPIIFGLTLLPCLAFLLYALYRRNVVAVVPTCLFTVCHVLQAFHYPA